MKTVRNHERQTYASLVAAASLASTVDIAAASGLDLIRVTGLNSLLGLLGLLGGPGGTLNLGLGDLDINRTASQLSLVMSRSSLLGLDQGLVSNKTISEGARSTGDDVGPQAIQVTKVRSVIVECARVQVAEMGEASLSLAFCHDKEKPLCSVSIFHHLHSSFSEG